MSQRESTEEITSHHEDTATAHKTFSTQCFNGAWEMLGKTNRSEVENEEMLRLSMASMWHWTQRPDCSPRNLAMGYWQVSRVHAVLGRADESRRYGELCLAASRKAGSDLTVNGDAEMAQFMLAYSYEALARAESAADNAAERDQFIAEARRLAESVSNQDHVKMLLDDLATIP